MVGFQHRIDDGSVGLRATDKEKHVGIGLVASLTDLSLGGCAEIVQAVACSPLIIGLAQPLEDSLVATVVVIALK